METEYSKFCLEDLGEKIVLNLTEAQFSSLKGAKAVIVECTGVEANFDAIVENYIELEETLFHLGMNHLAFGFEKKYTFDGMRNLVSRRLLNLFSSMRLYRDALARHAPRIFGRGSTSDKIEQTVVDGPNQPMPYRIIEAVRNYSQHESLPVSGLSLGSRWDRNDETTHRLAYSITPTLNGPDVGKKRGLPDDVKSALFALGRAEIMPLVRQALEQWSAIHGTFREEAVDVIDKSEALIRKAVADVQGAASVANSEFAVNVPDVALLVRRNGETREETQLFNELLDILARFRTKNGSLVNLSRRYVEWSDKLKK